MESNEAKADESIVETAIVAMEVASQENTSALAGYNWKLPDGTRANPAEGDIEFVHLLMEDVFIDKSAALHYLISRRFNTLVGDFRPTPLLVVYPRRFAKTTLMQFIEAVFSPVPRLKGHNREDIRAKMASLERGQELLNFGMHPVVRLDMQSIEHVDDLHHHINERLILAGLDAATAGQLKSKSRTPRQHLKDGVKLLNERFQTEFNLETHTIVLIDEHDKPFRNRNLNVKQDDYTDDTNDNDFRNKNKSQSSKNEILPALITLYGLGKEDETGISLLVLCGLTRMVGAGLSHLHNCVDISQKSEYHGLCGISALEFIKSCKGELDKYAKDNYEGKSLEAVLKTIFVPKWDGFRFGLDRNVGWLDASSPDGALFSPLDAWEIIESLVNKLHVPSSRWIRGMNAEFEFTAFAAKFNSSQDGFIELARNLEGGWIDASRLVSIMDRGDYLLLSDELHVKKVLFELGLLSVKQVGENNEILLGSTNWAITQNAMRLLVKKTHRGPTHPDLATFYLDEERTGFGELVNQAKTAVTNMFRGTGRDEIREYPFQDFLFMQLFYRFPIGERAVHYKLYKESKVWKTERMSSGRLDMGIALLYSDGPKKAFIIEVKLAKIDDARPEMIDVAHQRNLREATEQVRSYQWIGDRVDSVQRVAVSGVWHPSNTRENAFELSADYVFER